MSESITIGIPAYDEEKNIEEIVRDAVEIGRPTTDDLEILVVDDASTDGTAEILQRLGTEYPELRVVRHSKNGGIIASFMTIFGETRKELLFIIAADRQWKMEELPKMLEVMRTGPYDLVIGNRVSKQYTPYRKIISSSFRVLCETLFRVKVWDPGSIKLMRAPIREIQVDSRGVFEQAERIIRAYALGYKVTKVDVEHMPRTSGKARGASLR